MGFTSKLLSDLKNGKVERVVLFDIDGTLVRAARRSRYRTLIREMMFEVFGTSGRITEVDFSGETDLAIYAAALACEGITLDMIRQRLSLLEEAKVGVLNRLAAEGGEVFHICPGVRDLLEALSVEPRFASSLLTGNLERLAEAKLQLVGLWDYFRLRGAFGSDHPDRNQLPSIAARRINEQLGKTMSADQFVILGDTPRDIACARHFGAHAVAVASGQHTREQLAAHSPDCVLDDLSETGVVISLLGTL